VFRDLDAVLFLSHTPEQAPLRHVRRPGGWGEMRIELSTRAAADALAEYLRRCECVVSYTADCVLEASARPRSQSEHESRIELEGYLRVWRAMHPEVSVKAPSLAAVD
jgi:hypothetical protein